MSAISGVSFYGHESTGSTSYSSAAKSNLNNKNAETIYFKDNDYPYYNHEPKNNHTGLKVAGTILAISAAALCVAGAKKGEGKGVAKMLDGIQKIWNSAKEYVTSFMAKPCEQHVYNTAGQIQPISKTGAEILSKDSLNTIFLP